MTILDYVRKQATEQPDKPAIIHEGEAITYGELYPKMAACQPLPIPLLGNSWEGNFCLYTTGTTGLQKGVIISQKAVIANSENLIAGQGYSNTTMFIIAGNMHHLGCWSKIFPTLMVGGTLIILPDGMKDINAFFNAFEPSPQLGAGRLFATFLVPSNIRILLQFSNDRLKALADRIDFIETGAAPISQTDMEKLCQLLPHTRLYNTYASTETGIIATYNYNPTSPSLKGMHPGECLAGCLGSPLPHSNLFITPEGHIACQGDTLMSGYKNDKQLTQKVLHDNTLFTSDIGFLDDQGRLHILGRDDDIINVGGYKVSPAEIENVVMQLSEIEDCICIAKPHPLLGHAPSMLLVMKQGEKLDKRKVAQHIASKLDRHKVPLTYDVVDTIKRNINGKLDRKFYIMHNA